MTSVNPELGTTPSHPENLEEFLSAVHEDDAPLIQSSLSVYRIVLKRTWMSTAFGSELSPDRIFFTEEDGRSEHYLYHDVAIMGGWGAATDYCKYLCQSLTARDYEESVNRLLQAWNKYTLHGISLLNEAMAWVSPEQIKETRDKTEAIRHSISKEDVALSRKWARHWRVAAVELSGLKEEMHNDDDIDYLAMRDWKARLDQGEDSDQEDYDRVAKILSERSRPPRLVYFAKEKGETTAEAVVQ